jgi:hypothetical protein
VEKQKQPAASACVYQLLPSLSALTLSLSLCIPERVALQSLVRGRLILQAELSTYSWWTHFIIQHFNIEQPRGETLPSLRPFALFIVVPLVSYGSTRHMGARPGHSWSNNLVQWRLQLKLPANMLLCKCVKLTFDCIMRNLMHRKLGVKCTVDNECLS